ncbi:MAG: NADP-specific glutamate dehydrogenase [Spirochaetes bacterium]|nr:NADP-specific glutamate dehydrogenase [Spirochaetota bacterium]
MNSYIKEVLERTHKKYSWEHEFLQAATEVLESLNLIIERVPKYKKHRILERITEPERIITFRVPWQDDRGEIRVNTGYRVEFNSTLGPYKGGLRFHPSVTLSGLKFLGFEQTFKNSLTGLPIGGGKGGSDFNVTGRSDNEVMRFCQSFMNELYRHVGPDTDVPAGDIGVGGREIGYLFGQYKKLVNRFEGWITGKGLNWGGSLIRPEATGFGAIYFAEEMLKMKNDTLEGKTLAVSGFGNVAWGCALKASELGAKIIAISGPDGFVYDKDGIIGEKIDYMLKMRASGKDIVEDYVKKFSSAEFFPGKRPWGLNCDIALPCAIQNELDENDAKELTKNQCKMVIEVSNMGCTPEAIQIFQQNNIPFAPGKAANAGGVATSGLEMSQNSMRLKWDKNEVDAKLKNIMINIHNNCIEAADEYSFTGDYISGANIAGFKKVADAMIEQGLV